MNCNPILVEDLRGGVVESFHRGVICVVNKDKEIVYSEGNVHQLCYPRSALKPFQVIPLIESGAADYFQFSQEEIAVMCGSHNGEAEHQRVVDSILSKCGLDRSYLGCGIQQPTLKEDQLELIRNNQPAEAIHNNCSGKHAGFLAMAVFLEADTKTYLNPQHPVQQLVKQAVVEMYEYDAGLMVTAYDGCTAPIFSIPVWNQALAYRNLVHPTGFPAERKQACKRIVEAMAAFPYMVAGKKRYCTDMMELCGDKVIGKTGAEGVYGLSFRQEGVGVCIKMDDGKQQTQFQVAQKLLRKSGRFTAEELAPLARYEHAPIKNFNRIETGETRVAADILENFYL